MPQQRRLTDAQEQRVRSVQARRAVLIRQLESLPSIADLAFECGVSPAALYQMLRGETYRRKERATVDHCSRS